MVSERLVAFFFQAEDGIRDSPVTGVQTCALPIYVSGSNAFDPKEKVEGKVSKRHSYFIGPPKKVGPKMIYFYCMKAYRD